MSQNDRPMSVRLTEEQHQGLRRLAYEFELTRGEVIRRAIDGLLDSPIEQKFLLNEPTERRRDA